VHDVQKAASSTSSTEASKLQQLHQVSPDFRERGESKTHKNDGTMPQTLIGILADCYFYYV
jgi:hypothetical protein